MGMIFTKRWMALILLALVLGAGSASAHRMFADQRINVETYAMFDDGSPANNALIKTYRENTTSGLYELYREDRMDSSGKHSLTLPGKGTGNWLFEITSGGHKEELFINISNTRSEAAKVGIAAAAAMVPLAFVAYRGRKKR